MPWSPVGMPCLVERASKSAKRRKWPPISQGTRHSGSKERGRPFVPFGTTCLSGQTTTRSASHWRRITDQPNQNALQSCCWLLSQVPQNLLDHPLIARLLSSVLWYCSIAARLRTKPPHLQSFVPRLHGRVVSAREGSNYNRYSMALFFGRVHCYCGRVLLRSSMFCGIVMQLSLTAAGRKSAGGRPAYERYCSVGSGLSGNDMPRGCPPRGGC